MLHPLVSIGIPTYNRPRELERSIKIACEQTYRNIEIVIIDNCSTNPEVERVIALAKQGDKRIRSFRNKTNLGVLKNTKLVLDAARGEYFCWFSDDDWRSPEFIETLVELLENSPEVHLAFCDYREILDDLQLAQGYPHNHRKGLQKFAHKSSILRMLEYYWQDQKNGKCNIFYSLFRRNSLLKLNFERISQGFTLLSMDNYIAMSMIQMSKLSFHNDVLCALTCNNKKHYFKYSKHQRLSPSLFFKFLNFIHASFDELKISKQISTFTLTNLLLNCLFLPKLIKEVFLRIFHKVTSIRKQSRKDKIAIKKILNAESLNCPFYGQSSNEKKLYIPNLTLIAVATKDLEKTAMALRYSKSEINFGAVKLLAHYKPWNVGEEIEYSRIKPFRNVDDWGKFIIYDLHNYVETDFIMLIHADGFIVNPKLWNADFLNYDYIGSPWPIPKDPISYRDGMGTLYRVGNSVSVRSKKLLQLPSILKLPWEPFNGMYNEDGFLCVKHRKTLEREGVCFAKLDDAKHFAHERMLPETQNLKPFAFHKWQGNNNIYPKFSKY